MSCVGDVIIFRFRKSMAEVIRVMKARAVEVDQV